MAFFDFLRRILPWNSKPKTPAGGHGPASPATPTTPSVASSPGAKLHNEDFLLSGTWLHVASSNVESLRYLWDSEILEVSFKSKRLANGKVTPEAFYNYFNVPPNVADAMTTTGSPGRFVWNSLRDKFPYVRLSGFASTTKTVPTVVRARHDLGAKKNPLAIKPKWMK